MDFEYDYLEDLAEKGTSVTVYVVNGFQLHGVIYGFDDSVIILVDNGKHKLIYKSSISTIEPCKARNK